MPIKEGHPIKEAIQSSEIAGNTLNHFLQKLLEESCKESLTLDVVQEIKEKLCFVSKK